MSHINVLKNILTATTTASMPFYGRPIGGTLQSAHGDTPFRDVVSPLSLDRCPLGLIYNTQRQYFDQLV